MERRGRSHFVGSLEAKVAIVTGAAGGIGTAIVLALAEEGARIAVCNLASRHDDGLAALANAISDKGGRDSGAPEWENPR